MLGDLKVVQRPRADRDVDVTNNAQDWALRHTGRNPDHDLFRREYTDHARVTQDGQTPTR